jgi:hypothetical protein
MTYYLHIKAHQDDDASFTKLSRKAQLNCICDHAAKQRKVADGMDGVTSRGMFPLESIGLFVRGEKITSDTGEQICFGAHRQLAKDFFNNRKILLHSQFESIDWISIHQMLHDLPRLFLVWAAKQVLRIASTMKFLAHKDDRSPLCPSCQECHGTCRHVAHYPKVGCAAAFEQSMQRVEQWLERQNTQPDLQSLLLRYLRGRGTVTCLDCSMALNLPQLFQEFAKSQDVIGWDNFEIGMVSIKLPRIQSSHLTESDLSFHAMQWISGFITQLCQMMHTQWIYQSVLIHNPTTGTLISTHKEDLLKEIEYQLTLGPDTVADEDRFLLECNFDDLTTSTGEHQEIWPLAICSQRGVMHMCNSRGYAAVQPNSEQRRA